MPAPWYDDGQQAGTGANSEGASGGSRSNVLLNVTAVTQAAFELTGGLYAIETQGTGAGSITLQKLATDGATWYTVSTSVVAGPTLVTVQLPRGQYRWTTAGFTAVWASASRVPQA